MDGDGGAVTLNGGAAEPCNEMSSLYHEAGLQQALWCRQGHF